MASHSKKDIRKKQILDAALDVVVNKGYSNSTMEDIVRRSHLSKGAIYWYYKSKKEIFLSLVNHWVNNFGATLNHIVEENQSASEQLSELFNFFLTAYEQNPKVFRAELEFWSLSSRDPSFHAKTQKVYNELLELVEGIVRAGVQSGEFKNLDVDVAALSIMVNLEGIIWFTLFDVPGLSARHYIETITGFILAGLRTRPEGDSHG